MANKKYDILELLKLATKFKGDISWRNHNRFQTLLAKGYDPKVYAALERSLAHHDFMESLDSDPFNKPDQMSGDIILGKNSTGISRYKSSYAPSHLLGIGATGVGKTVFLVFLILQYLLIASGIWVFDFVKREFRGLKRLAENIGKKFIVCRHNMLRINPLEPQQVEPSLHANTASEFITLSLNLPPVAKLILKICIANLYSKFGLFTVPDADPPTLFDLLIEVENFDGNKAAKEAILIRLRALLVNQRATFNLRRGMPVSKLSEYFIDFELDGLEMEYQNLNVAYLLSTLFAQRVNNRSNKLVAIVLDEAARLYSRKQEAANNGPSYISMMTSVIRKMKIALFVMSQSSRDLSPSIISNSGIKVLFRVGSADDYDIFGRSMGLTSSQIQFCKTGLDIGIQVIKMGFGWLEPFFNMSPDILIPENISDLEVNQSAQELLNLIPKPTVPKLILPKQILNNPVNTVQNNPTDDENSLLKQIKSNPDIVSATDHYRMAGLSTKRGQAAKRGLINKNLIKQIPLESGRRGRAKLFLEVIETVNAGKLGKALHNHIRNIADRWHKSQSCLTEVEKLVKVGGRNRFVDLLVIWPNGKREAIEIETEYGQRAIENIKKNLAMDFDQITVLTPNKKVRDSIKYKALNQINNVQMFRVKFPSLNIYKDK